MIQEPFPTAEQSRRRPRRDHAAVPARRRLIGVREIVLVLIAFSLLALAPSIAQVAGFGRDSAVRTAGAALGSAERPESNFAGSAFYFLEPEQPIAQNYTAASGEVAQYGAGDNAALIGESPPQFPPEAGNAGDSFSNIDARGLVAKPFVIRPGSADYSRAIKCLTDAVYYEAATESDSGQRAVAQVIINRMRHPTYPNNICGVIYQGSERRTGCQFSYSCDGSMARTPSAAHWNRAYRVAASALSGYVHAPVGMATHYHTVNIYPYWAPSLNFVGTIGAHRFYTWKGSAGRPSAFFRSYAGNEPFPGPKPRAWNAPTAPLFDPIQLQKQYEREYAAVRLKAEREAISAAAAGSIAPEAAYSAIAPGRQRAAPIYTAPEYSRQAKIKGGDQNYGGAKLPDNTNIRPEYQDSGSWKSQPTG